MIREIIQLERAQFEDKDTVLRRVSESVVEFDESLAKLVQDLDDTMRNSSIAIGLSAPQIGELRRVTVINLSEGKSEPSLVLVNPIVQSESGKKDIKKESCMSLPHFRGAVERRSKMHVTYQDQTGKTHHLALEGFMARVLAHEIDHLNGILYIDRMATLDELEDTDIFRNAEKLREVEPNQS